MRNLIPILLAVVVLSSGCDPDGYSCNSEGCYAENNAQYLTLEDCLSVCDEITPTPGNCGDLVSHEGYDYSTVQIGDQCWFAENCRYLPSVSTSSEGSQTFPYYYVYDYEGSTLADAKATENYETYGVLYNWPAVMTEGICPSGWHVPNHLEFIELIDFLGGGSVAGGKMKELGYIHWNEPNLGATNLSGFNALPGGGLDYSYDMFCCRGNTAEFWTSIADGSTSALTISNATSNEEANMNGGQKHQGYSARCVRDGYSCNSEGCYADDDSPQYQSLEDCLSVCDEITPTPGNCVDPVSHQGYDYSVVQIGDQCWFSENCRYLPIVSDPSNETPTEPHYSVNGYTGTDVTEAQSTSNYETYGVLYNWPAVMTEGICPSGWHVPSDGEFIQLRNFLGGEPVAGHAMKATSGWNNEGNGSNSSGWNGLPGGSKSGGFGGVGDSGKFWTSTESGTNSIYLPLRSSSYSFELDEFGPTNSFSARCVRD